MQPSMRVLLLFGKSTNLYKDNPKHIMSDELLEKFIDEYINSQTMPQVLFTWHGGETLMRPLSFYKRQWNCKEIRPWTYDRQLHPDQRNYAH